MNILTELEQHIIIPVVVLNNAADAAPLGDALVAGGLPVAEVTFRTAAAAESIKTMAERGDILVGAGTVLTPEQVNQAVDAGARYIVSPGLSAAVVEQCRKRDVPVLPGAVTPSEIQQALELGIKTVKFFPAGTNGGASAIKALSAPFVDVSFVPTGGVSPDNLADYLAVPAVRAVGGSWMVPGKLIEAGEFDTIIDKTANAVELAHSLRSTTATEG
ncbi:MAG: bifunctional 4-hydroxy-2-oxoglutarate aldolase/2-dehydro-3-deoxy-phosphogluconate aldolase [Actinomycetaceae bacterium]|nr:bifunctional 4-hydroxy-2-oxoglutarate aldolase/2-dehydro-3-deoxy-phosphogluconate aldolase [Actinomycetaceae bacterium]